MLLSISVKYSHSYEINVCCLRDAPYGGFPFPSVCFSNQQMLVLLQDHSASTSSLFDICDKKAIFITVRTLVFLGANMPWFLNVATENDARWFKWDKRQRMKFFFISQANWQTRINLKVILSTKRYLQFIIHVLWFRHPVSFLKQVCNFTAIHPWIWWTTWKKEQTLRLYVIVTTTSFERNTTQ